MVATAAHRRWPWPTGCHPRSAATAAQPLSSTQSPCRCQAICKHLPQNLKNTRSPAPPFLLAVALDQDSHNLKNPAAWPPKNLETARPKNLKNNTLTFPESSCLPSRLPDSCRRPLRAGRRPGRPRLRDPRPRGLPRLLLVGFRLTGSPRPPARQACGGTSARRNHNRFRRTAAASSLSRPGIGIPRVPVRARKGSLGSDPVGVIGTVKPCRSALAGGRSPERSAPGRRVGHWRAHP